MNTIIDYLTTNKQQYLATVGLDGRPKVRPFQFMLEEAVATIADFSGNPPRTVRL